MVIGAALFFKPWLPPLASDRGELDRLFYVILIITGAAFVLVQLCTGYFIWKYSSPALDRPPYLKDHHALEITWTAVTAGIMCFLAVWGTGLWKKVIFSRPPQAPVLVEITAQQFQWNIRYPGKDGAFGRTNPKLISDENPLGLDSKDPASKDDVVTQDVLYLPVDKPAELRIRSKDVIHSFFLPNFRVKQDAVPGMTIETWFTPTRLGEYEIACAQFCGLGHYTMRGKVNVVTSEEFERKLKELRTGNVESKS